MQTKSADLVENAVKHIEAFARELLEIDKKIISSKEFKEKFKSPVTIITRLEHWYIIERELLCLSAVSIRLKEIHDNPKILIALIERFATKYYQLNDPLIIRELKHTSATYVDFVEERLDFYQEEIATYLEMKNPMAARIIYYQFYPLQKISDPKFNIEDAAKSEGIIVNLILENIFKSVTLPMLLETLPNSIKNLR